LYELEKHLCKQTLLTSIASITGGNPFDTMHSWFKTARGTLLGFAGGGSILMTMQNGVESLLPFKLPAFLRAGFDLKEAENSDGETNELGTAAVA